MAMNLDDIRFLRKVGHRIRELRMERGLTQAQLADQCRTFIGSVERGERNVSILNLRAISKQLRTPIQELFGDSSASSK
jgi:transcriptional regulator with XRE-family HTH domain